MGIDWLLSDIEPWMVNFTVSLASVVRAPNITCADASLAPGPLAPMTTNETTTMIATAAPIITNGLVRPRFGEISSDGEDSAPATSPKNVKCSCSIPSSTFVLVPTRRRVAAIERKLPSAAFICR